MDENAEINLKSESERESESEEIYNIPDRRRFGCWHLKPLDGFTAGKRYKVLNEVVKGMDVIYSVIDDAGELRHIPHSYFNPPIRILSADFEKVPMIDLRGFHEDLRKDGQLTDCGIPQIVWNFHEMLKQAEDFKHLCGVKHRRQMSLVALDNLSGQISILIRAAEAIQNELDTLKFEIAKKEGE